MPVNKKNLNINNEGENYETGISTIKAGRIVPGN